MRIMFILPSVGRRPGQPYVRTWLMEPLGIAVLSALTPRSFERRFYDDRLEEIPYDAQVDIVALSVETYTARRAYEIAARFRARGITVIMGGFHATLVPDEVAAHADCVVIGNAEPVWSTVCDDLCAGQLKSRYESEDASFSPVLPDRTIYEGKKYSSLSLVETGRGCPLTCEFCSISSFFGRRYTPRAIGEVVREIRAIGARRVFFIDDNIAVDRQRTVELLKALIPLRISWCGQVSLAIAHDTELLNLMRQSGCRGVLIGFESMDEANLRTMRKAVNSRQGNYTGAIESLRRAGIAVYATFMFGYDGDTRESFERTLTLCREQRFFFAAFNHLVPFPGTPLYERLKLERRLSAERWWLSPRYRFGDVAFTPRHLTAQELSVLCLQYRRRFYSIPSILHRALDRRANCRDAVMALIYFVQNIVARFDVDRRQGLPLGTEDHPGDGDRPAKSGPRSISEHSHSYADY